ncbi:uncharacterized protein LOC123008483 [Tribolium madens]|uniref:uncharacterized protein LOC123008483 n=1 Tax=Tribolium madens TaxID=41895 RepID=UPI001CF75DE3|nr:uncharacterized protein LOC123008483 [Tribolium madens]
MTQKIQSGVVNLGSKYEELFPAKFALKLLRDPNVEDFNFVLNYCSFKKFDDLVVNIKYKNCVENFAIQLKHRETGRDVIGVEELDDKGKNFIISNFSNAYKTLDSEKQQSYKFILFTNAKFENLDKSKPYQIEKICPPFKTKIFATDGIVYKFKKKEPRQEEFFEKFFLCSGQKNVEGLRNDIVTIFETDFFLSKDVATRIATCYESFFADLHQKQFDNTKIDKNTVILKLIDLILEDYIIYSPLSENFDEKTALFAKAIKTADVTCLLQINDKDRNCKNADLDKELQKIATQHKLIFPNKKTESKKNTRILSYFKEKPLFVRTDKDTQKTILSLINLSQNLYNKIKFVLVGKLIGTVEITTERIFTNLSDLKKLDSSLYDKITKRFKIKFQGRQEETIETLQNTFGLPLDEFVTPSELFEALKKDWVITPKVTEALPKPFLTRFLTREHIQVDKLDDKTIVHCGGQSKQCKAYLKNYSKILITEEKNCKSCFHHLKFGDNKIEWIERKVSPDNPEIFDYQLSIICGNPGIGKTTMMKYLTFKCPLNYWVVNVSLKKWSSFLKKSHSVEEILNQFLTPCNKFATNIMNFLKCEKKIIFFFDGLDELNDDCISGTIKTTKLLLEEGYKCWISCTIRLKPTLKTHFSQYQIYDIEEIGQEEQENYIREKLQSEKKPPEFIETQIRKISKANVDILKFPICLYILTEVLTKSDTDFEDNLSLLHLYECFIDARLQHELEKAHYDTRQDNLKVPMKTFKHFHIKECQIAALRTCLEPSHFDLLKVTNEAFFVETLRQNGDFLKLISEVNSKNRFVFIHFTIAQYFAATWLKNNVKEISKWQFLFKPQYIGIRYFLNVQMAENCPLHLAILNQDLSNVEKLAKEHLNDLDKGGRSPLHLASSIETKHPISHSGEIQNRIYFKDNVEEKILQLLLDLNVNALQKDELFRWNAFEYADASLSLSSLEALSKKEDLKLEYLQNYNELEILAENCIKFGYFNLLKSLTNLKSLSDLDKNEKSLLHQAIENQQEEIAVFLIEKGANLDQSLLHPATFWGCTKVVQLLLNRNIEVDIKDSEDKTPLHWAAKLGNTHILQLLIDKSAKIDSTDVRKRTPLHKASYMGKNQAVKILLKNNANVNFRDNDDKTPLQRASDMGHYETVKILVESCADINAIDKNKRTALHYAAFEGHFQVVEYLVMAKIDVTALDDDGKTALDLAQEKGHKKIVQILQKSQNKSYNPETHHENELHYAAKMGNLSKIEQLLNSGFNIEETDKDGQTALHLASISGHSQVVKFLLSKSASKTAKNRDDRIPLHLASQHGHKTIVEYLLDENINAWDRWKLTPLHRAAYKGHQAVVELLIESKADLEAAQIDGGTPLHSAAFGGHNDIIKFLVEKGANWKATNKNKETCLHEAALKGCTETVCFLIKENKDLINKTDCRERTALHWAAEKGYGNMIRYLVEAGAEVGIKDRWKKTALDVAREAGKEEIVRYLEGKKT